MGSKLVTLGLWVLLAASQAFGYEYHLQRPSAHSGATTYGQAINADNAVNGGINYFTPTCVSRTCGPRTYHCDLGTWDFQGNLISWTAGVTQSIACVLPQPNAVNGTQQIYAESGPSTTGYDSAFAGTAGGGFFATPASHFAWASQGGIQVIPYAPDVFQIVVNSDGDLPLDNTSTVATNTFVSIYDQGVGTTAITATGAANDCLTGPVAAGTSCVLNVTYDPSSIKCSTSPYGYAYQAIAIELVSDAGNLPEWGVHYTVTGVPRCDE